MPNKEHLKMPFISEDQYNKFWSKVVLTANIDKCWTADWTKGKVYPEINFGGKMYKANRISYYIFYKVDPGDKFVCHSCDNSRCVNPHHLFLGTCNDNNQDKRNKGRHVAGKGEKHWSNRFTKEQVLHIRDVYSKENPPTYKETAKKYNVDASAIGLIVRRRNWKHI